MEELLRQLEVAAIDAGILIMRMRAAGTALSKKSDGSPVTDADCRAEELILRALAQIDSATPVVAEELENAATSNNAIDSKFYLVDPLDGTKEFIKGASDFTVNIGLVVAGVPVAGVVVQPAAGRLYSGSDGAATMAEFSDDGRITGRSRIRSGQNGDKLVAVVSASHACAETELYLDRFDIGERVSIGSSLKFCLVACGQAAIYPRLGRTMQWDTAAGDAVLRNSGGSVQTLDGLPLTYGPRSGVISNRFANPHFVALAGNASSLV